MIKASSVFFTYFLSVQNSDTSTLSTSTYAVRYVKIEGNKSRSTIVDRIDNN